MSDHITTISPRGRAWMVALEGGHRLTAYRDMVAGIWSIGAGLIRWPGGRRIQYGDTISSAEAADELFSETLVPFEKDVDALTRDDLLQYEFDAMVSLCYNIGTQNLATSTVLKRINLGAPQASIAEAWGWFHFSQGQPSPGLATRRKREIEVFEGGQYRDQGGLVIGG